MHTRVPAEPGNEAILHISLACIVSPNLGMGILHHENIFTQNIKVLQHENFQIYCIQLLVEVCPAAVHSIAVLFHS